jgi:hypothetical protein
MTTSELGNRQIKEADKKWSELGVVSNELEVKYGGGRDSVINHSTSAAVVVKRPLLLEKTNGRALAGVNDGDARLGHTSSICLPHAVKLGDIIVSFLQHLLRAIEASAIDNNGLGKMAVVGCCICIHGAVKKRVDVRGVLLAFHVFETARKEFAGVVCV